MRSRTVRMSARCAAVLVSGLLFVGSTQPAQAQPKPPPGQPAGQPAKKPMTDKQKKDAAGKAYKDAQAKFDKGDYAGAVVLYEEADGLFSGAKPKQRAALSYDKLNKPKEAVAWYEKFLADSPDPEKFKNNEIPDAKSRVEALKKTPAKVKVTTEPAGVAGVKFAVDGASQAGPELSVPPGKHKISASATGYDTATQDVDVAFADTKEIKITLAKSTAAPPPVVAAVPPPATNQPPTTNPEPDKPSEPRSNVPAYVTLGLAGVGVVVGTIFGISALSAKSDFDADPTTENADKTDRNALIADMSFAVALTFGVTGTVLLLSNGKSDDAKPAAAARRGFVAPYVAPKGGGAAAMFTF